jgi:hypothetical protein
VIYVPHSASSQSQFFPFLLCMGKQSCLTTVTSCRGSTEILVTQARCCMKEKGVSNFSQPYSLFHLFCLNKPICKTILLLFSCSLYLIALDTFIEIDYSAQTANADRPSFPPHSSSRDEFCILLRWRCRNAAAAADDGGGLIKDSTLKMEWSFSMQKGAARYFCYPAILSEAIFVVCHCPPP